MSPLRHALSPPSTAVITLATLLLAGNGLVALILPIPADAAPKGRARTPLQSVPSTPAAEAQPILTPLAKGVTVLRVRFGSKPVPGKQGPQGREPTRWDGQLQVTGGNDKRDIPDFVFTENQ